MEKDKRTESHMSPAEAAKGMAGIKVMLALTSSGLSQEDFKCVLRGILFLFESGAGKDRKFPISANDPNYIAFRDIMDGKRAD